MKRRSRCPRGHFASKATDTWPAIDGILCNRSEKDVMCIGALQIYTERTYGKALHKNENKVI